MTDEFPGRLPRYQPPSLEELKRDLKSDDPGKKARAITLFHTQYNQGQNSDERLEAGRALGYSDLRLRFHEWRLRRSADREIKSD